MFKPLEHYIDVIIVLGLKNAAFIGSTNTRKAVHLTMVTTYGVRQNSHSGIIQSEVTLEDLFA